MADNVSGIVSATLAGYTSTSLSVSSSDVISSVTGYGAEAATVDLADGAYTGGVSTATSSTDNSASQLELLLTSDSSILIDLDGCVESHAIDIRPSFTYTELANGNLIQKYDLGITSDKYHSDISLVLSFNKWAELRNFLKSTSGKVLTIKSKLDLFFPNIIATGIGVIVSEYKDEGYAEDITSGHRRVTLRLYSTSRPSWNPSGTVPSVFNRSIWEQDYTPSNVLNPAFYGSAYDVEAFENDSNSWTISLENLTKPEAQAVLVYLLTVRASQVQLNSYGRNAAESGNLDFYKVSTYHLESFSIDTSGIFYHISIAARERCLW